MADLILDFVKCRAPCPACGTESPRHSVAVRRPTCITGKPVNVRTSKHYCPRCRRHFTPENPFIGRGRRYADDARRRAAGMVLRGEGNLTQISKLTGIAVSTLCDWVAQAEEAEVDARAV